MSKITYIYSSHGYCSHMSNMRKYLKDTDSVVRGPKSRKIFKCHGYCNHRSIMRKYLDVWIL